MTLPTIFPPASLPKFLAAGHGIELGRNYAPVARGRGHSRHRRKSTGAPRIVPVAWSLTPEQAVDFDFWIETTLDRGTLHFVAEVANQGPGQRFWDAVWLSPPRAVAKASPQGVIWTVAGRLLLTGEGEATRPVTGDLAAEIEVPLLGSASLVLPATPLEAEITVALLPSTALAAEITVPLLPLLVPLAAEILVPLDGSGTLGAGTGGVSGGTLFVGELASSDLREATGILFPNDTVEFDSDGNAIYTPRSVTTFTRAASAPSRPIDGDRWWRTTTDIEYTYDAVSTSWVQPP